MIEAADAFPMNLGFSGKGNAAQPKALIEQIQGGACVPQAARGLGHHAGRHRLRAVGGRRLRRADHDPHRHAQRVGLRGGHHRRLQGPHHPRLPHRRRRRRARAGHHQGGGPPERAALVHQPDAPLHGEHAGGASRHAHGVPPPRRQHPRGHRLRREPHPPRDHRRGGHPARHRRALHDLLRQPGHGPRRRGDHPHLADGAQDEGAARAPEGGRARQRQLPRQALHRQVHHQPGHRARRGARAGLAGGGQARRPRAVEPRLLRREARHGAAGRHHRRGAHGRPQRLDPHAAAGALPPHVRRLRQGHRRLRRHVRQPGRHRRLSAAAPGRGEEAASRSATPAPASPRSP